MNSNTAVFGELSLAGEIRPVNKGKQRIKAAQSLGFTDIAGPEKEEGSTQVQTIKELVKQVFKK